AEGPAPPELVQLRKQAQVDVREMLKYQGSTPDFIAQRLAVESADRGYYTRQHFSMAPADFVERHLKTLIKLGKEQNKRIKDVIEGSTFTGKRGVNDFIDRPAMD
ncbi:hypothetical protein, partial [Pseudomonas sp. DC1.2]